MTFVWEEGEFFGPTTPGRKEYLKDRWDEIMIFDGDFFSEIDCDQDYDIKGIDNDDNFIKMIMTTIKRTALCSF